MIPVTCKILRGTEKLNEEQGTVGGDGKIYKDLLAPARSHGYI